ncbi:MAG: hypothetical protein C4307_04135, partial [Chloroflexota bacterium]
MEVERTEHGRVSVSQGALKRLIVEAAQQVEGARVRRPRRALRVELRGGAARVEVELAVRRGRVLPEVAREVQQRVAGALEEALEAPVE